MKTDSLEVNDTEHESGPEFPRSNDHPPLRECVNRALKNYFTLVGNEPVSNLYDLVLTEVEAPLLEAVMKQTRSNQTKASRMLGLNRGTLRKKLKQYDLL